MWRDSGTAVNAIEILELVKQRRKGFDRISPLHFQTTKDRTMSNKPVLKSDLGHLSVAIWENERDENGGTFRSISVSRRYFDRKKNDWEATSMSLNPSDIPAVIRLLQSIETQLIQPTSAT